MRLLFETENRRRMKLYSYAAPYDRLLLIIICDFLIWCRVVNIMTYPGCQKKGRNSVKYACSATTDYTGGRQLKTF